MPALQKLVASLGGLLEAAAAPLPSSATPFSGLKPVSVDALWKEPGAPANHCTILFICPSFSFNAFPIGRSLATTNMPAILATIDQVLVLSSYIERFL